MTILYRRFTRTLVHRGEDPFDTPVSTLDKGARLLSFGWSVRLLDLGMDGKISEKISVKNGRIVRLC